MKVAIVTGASSGIGKLLAAGLEKHASIDELWVIARGEEKLKALQAEVKVPVRPVPLDLTDAESTGRVKELLADEAAKGTSLAAIDAYGLNESGLDKICDITVAVTAPEEMRVRRIMERDGIDEEYALRRIRAQKQDDEYAAECDVELVNDFASKEEFENKCRDFIENILEV